MAAMKPRTGDGPLEVTKEGRGIVMRVPLEGGGRLVVELNADEATELGNALRPSSAERILPGCPRIPTYLRDPGGCLLRHRPGSLRLPVVPRRI